MSASPSLVDRFAHRFGTLVTEDSCEIEEGPSSADANDGVRERLLGAFSTFEYPVGLLGQTDVSVFGLVHTPTSTSIEITPPPVGHVVETEPRSPVSAVEMDVDCVGGQFETFEVVLRLVRSGSSM